MVSILRPNLANGHKVEHKIRLIFKASNAYLSGRPKLVICLHYIPPMCRPFPPSIIQTVSGENGVGHHEPSAENLDFERERSSSIYSTVGAAVVIIMPVLRDQNHSYPRHDSLVQRHFSYRLFDTTSNNKFIETTVPHCVRGTHKKKAHGTNSYSSCNIPRRMSVSLFN